MVFAERCLTNAEQSDKDVDAPPITMKSLILLSVLVIFGWTAVVTFAGPDLAKAIDKSLPGYVAKKPAAVKRVR
jgi:hypothetical protein